MLRTIHVYTVALAVLLLSLLLANAHSAPAPETKRPQWEYVTLRQTNYGVALELPDRVIRADTCSKVLEKLGRKSSRNDATAVLNVLGEEGWELVSHTHDAKEQAQTWTFKRRK